MASLHLWKHPRQITPWVLVIILLACTLLPASAAAPRAAASSAGSDGSVYSWKDTFVADIASRQGHSAVWTGTEMIVWGGYTSSGALNTGGRYNPATGDWKTISTEGAPEARASHTAVWTGTEMIVWGGENSSTYFNTGGRYNPATDTWAPLATTNAPAARDKHTAVWTGKEMIIWGGYVYDENFTYFDDGGRYDPATNTWTAVPTLNAPAARDYHTAVWTGTQMIIWGGYVLTDTTSIYLNTGGLYDPSNNTWTSTPIDDTVPVGRSDHSAVWTGTEMLIWGGCGNTDKGYACFNTGSAYNPEGKSWTDIPTTGAPDARAKHKAVFTGTEMLVWGGEDSGGYLNTGERYNLANKTWSDITTEGAPMTRYRETAVWTGTELLIWGGVSGAQGYIHLNTGGRYNPANDTWAATVTPASAPAARMGHTAVWTGTEMIIWGGLHVVPAIGTGARYNPTIDTWVATNSANAPEGRAYHTAVWTGTEMIVWGGMNSSYAVVNTGGRYNPISDTWDPTPMSTDGAPQGRENHTAVWSGGKMIIWGGGWGSLGADNSVGLYDPQSNTWELVASLDAPTARYDHTAVWTGTKMLVWGGRDSSGALNTGGRFDPAAKTWKPISTTNAPEPRYAHTAIWTGTKMIVWGGQDSNGTYFNTGGIYDPGTDQWETITLTNAPTARGYHTAVWTGDSGASTSLCAGADAVTGAVMVIWGGEGSTGRVNSGGCFNPTTHTWTATSTVNAPAARAAHTAIWTGGTTGSGEMIVWGGYGEYPLNTGGRYKIIYPAFLPMISLNRN